MTSPSQSTRTWQDLLREQAGVISRRQALAHGMTVSAWDWKHLSGRWSVLLPGVALSRGAGEPTDEELGWSAVLHCGEGAALTGDAALVAAGFRSSRPPRAVHVAVPEGRVVRSATAFRAGEAVRVVPHQVRHLDDLRHPVRRPPVLRVPAAALHAAAQAPTDRAAEWRLAAVVQQRLASAEQLREALERMPRLRRRALAAAVLRDVSQGAHAQSELDFLRLLRRLGLPPPDRMQRLVRANGKRYLDAWWERQRVAAEVDGAHHVEVGQWGDDVLRANAVVVAERHDRVLLLRFTTGNLRHDVDEVGRQLVAALSD